MYKNGRGVVYIWTFKNDIETGLEVCLSMDKE